MPKIISILKSHWEKSLLVVSLLFGIILFSVTSNHFTEEASSDFSEQLKQPKLRIFDWDKRIALPKLDGKSTNPFAHIIETKAPTPPPKKEETAPEATTKKQEEPPKPQPPKKEEPPKPQPPKKEEPPAPQPPKKEEPTKPQPPKKEEPPKSQPPKEATKKAPAKKYTITYRGIYGSLSGKTLVLLSITDNSTKKTEQKILACGDTFGDNMTIKAVSDSKILITVNGAPHITIDWNSAKEITMPAE